MIKLNELKLKDKALFDKFFALKSHELCAYSFANIYIWNKFFSIRWALIDGCLCIFFQDKIAAFLYCEPLGRISGHVVESVFEIMDSLNQHKNYSRIDNVPRSSLNFYKSCGYKCQERAAEYVSLRSSLVGLSGNKYKSKRACLNYFLKNYSFQYSDYSPRFKNDCLELYRKWSRNRSNPEYIYQAMLKDCSLTLKEALDNYAGLGLEGRVVRVSGELKGFTVGYRLNQDTFCILFEITDLSVKGLSQFIFRSFCSDLAGYQYINVMDDSGLANLRKVKLSYCPERLVPSYSVQR